MDYEKKYNQALERAKEVHNNPNASNIRKGWIEDIFPELRESEDEKIRRCIGMCLTDADEQRFKDFNTNLKACLNWLEKQGGIDNCPLEYSTNTVMTDSKKNQEEFQISSDFKQNPSWSEEDEARLKSCLDILQPITPFETTETINTKWLKSLKQRIGG